MHPDSIEIHPEVKRRQEASEEAFAELNDVKMHLDTVLDRLRGINQGLKRNRSISIAITEIEGGKLWLDNVAYVIAPPDPQGVLDRLNGTNDG